MNCYKKMYLRLFRTTADAIELLQESEATEKVIKLLQEVHVDCEEFFMEHGEE